MEFNVIAYSCLIGCFCTCLGNTIRIKLDFCLDRSACSETKHGTKNLQLLSLSGLDEAQRHPVNKDNAKGCVCFATSQLSSFWCPWLSSCLSLIQDLSLHNLTQTCSEMLVSFPPLVTANQHLLILP